MRSQSLCDSFQIFLDLFHVYNLMRTKEMIKHKTELKGQNAIKWKEKKVRVNTEKEKTRY